MDEKKFFIITNLFWGGYEDTIGYVLDTEENVKKTVKEINDKRKSQYSNTARRLTDVDLILYHEIPVLSLDKIKNDRRCIKTKKEVF